MPNPVILLVSEQHADFLLDEFGRYQRDYDLRTARSCAEALTVIKQARAEGLQVALFVQDGDLPDEHPLRRSRHWRAKVPTARRIIAAHYEQFLAGAAELRPGLAKGKYDAYLLMPRGVRDEEFHGAVTEMLSDWGSTVAAPEVETVRIVSPPGLRLTSAIREFSTGWACRRACYAPDSRGRPGGRRRASRQPAATCLARSCAAMRRPVIAPTSVREVAIGDLRRARRLRTSTASSTSRSSAPARPGSPPPCTARSEGLSTVVLEAEAIGGQAGTSSMIRNYLGFPRGISGMRLAQRARNQAIRFGTRFFTGWEVTALEPGADGAPTCVRTDGGDVQARAVVIATGVAYRKLGVEAIESLVGLGVHYGGAMTRPARSRATTSWSSAAATPPARRPSTSPASPKSVTIMVRRPRARGDDVALPHQRDRLQPAHRACRPAPRSPTAAATAGWSGSTSATPRPARSPGATPRACSSCSAPSRTATGCRPRSPSTTTASCSPAATSPRTTGPTASRPPNLATTVPGIFAVGDIRSGSMKRVASASGEGASVVSLVHAWLAP